MAQAYSTFEKHDSRLPVYDSPAFCRTAFFPVQYKYKELPEMQGAKVIATGGLSELVSNVENNIFDVVDRKLALEGLKIIYDLNK